MEGLEGEALKNVRAALAFPPGLVQDGKVDGLLLENFRQRIPAKVQEALEPFGYYEAQVTTAMEKTEEGFDRLRVKVIPGDPVWITTLTMEIEGPGRKEPSLQELVAHFPLIEGEVLNQGVYEKAKKQLLARAVDLGYLKAKFPTHSIRVNRAKREAEVALVLDTGPQYRFGEVTFSGAPEYPRSFLHRYLAFIPGEGFSYAKLGQTQLNLINSDRFKGVGIQAERKEAKDQFVPVTLKLEPSPPKRLRPGIGYGTDTGIRGALRYQNVNFFQTGHEWNIDLSVSEKVQEAGTRYIIPSPRDIDSLSSLALGFKNERTDSYDSRLFTVEPELIRSFRSGRIGSLFLQFRQEDYSVAGEDNRSRLIMPGLRLTKRKVDSISRPTRGYRYFLETRGTHQALGSDTGFVQQLVEGYLLQSLPGRFSLFARLQAGFTWQTESLQDLPASLRFFAGGDNSVRGYAYKSLGPTDESGQVTGGQHLLVGSLELERHFGKSWGVAVFYDAGNAFNTFSDLHLAQGAGVGVRYYTPIGPIKVDVARQIKKEDPRFRLHVTVGFNL